jgi:hypothetical protein
MCESRKESKNTGKNNIKNIYVSCIFFASKFIVNNSSITQLSLLFSFVFKLCLSYALHMPFYRAYKHEHIQNVFNEVLRRVIFSVPTHVIALSLDTFPIFGLVLFIGNRLQIRKLHIIV